MKGKFFKLMLQRCSAILFLNFAFVACQLDDPKEENWGQDQDKGEIIYSRQGNTPIILCKDVNAQDEIFSRSSSPYATKQYMGFAYDPERGIVGNHECFKRPVLDITRLAEERPRSFECFPLKRLVAECNTFASNNSFRSSMAKKYSNVFTAGIDFKIFKIGYERTFSSAFSSTFDFKERHVYAELNVLCQEARYTLERSKDLDNIIQNRYLSDAFRSNLYNTPFQELFPSTGRYGSLVVTQYILGGKANFLYQGMSKEETNETKLESEIRNKIDASCTITKGSFSITPSVGNNNGNSNSSSSSSSDFFESLRVVYETLGGAFAMGFSAPMKFDNLKVDFSPWVNSLNDKSTHVLIDIPGDGLVPITDFIQEENFKKRIEEGSYNTSFSEPYIEIRLGLNGDYWGGNYQSSPQFPYSRPLPLSLILHTRHGDEISLRPIHVNDNSFWQAQYKHEYNRKVKEIADYAHRYYNLDIRKTFYRSAIFDDLANKDPRMKSSYGDALGDGLGGGFGEKMLRLPKIIDLYGLKEDNLKRCKHPYYYNESKGQFMQYLYFVEGGKRYAFAIYDPYILDTYGIRALFNSAKEEPLSIYDLKNFRIIGL